MIYKTLLEVFQLHDQATGGLKTYALFLMIYTVVKSLPTRNIGELFYHIAMYFGFYFEYGYDFKGNFKNLKCEAEPFSEMRLDLIDPLNSKNNVGGKNMRTKELESMFRSIFYALHIKISGSMLNYLKQLPRIL